MATLENRLSRRKGKHDGDTYRLDTKKSPEENIIEIIKGLYSKKPFHRDSSTSPTNRNVPNERLGLRPQKSSSDSYRWSYLEALVTLLHKEDRNNLGFTPDELMTCIRISLIDESMVIRAAGLRVLRYLIKTEGDVATFNHLKLPYLVIRSMDLMLRNEEERAQALKVVRRVIAVVGAVEQGHRRLRAAYIDQGLLRCLAAVARAGSAGDGSGDRLSRPAIATLAEICVLNPDLFISCGGVTAVTRQLAECATPRMAEALCGVLLHTLNDPKSRNAARIDLTCLNSPYCDFHFRPAGTDTSRDEREMRFTCSRLALLCVLRSWPGLLHFCHPCSAGGLHALVAALYLPRLEVRKAILDLLYELVGLPQPDWTDEISVAIDAVDPADFQDSWRLNEGFVAAEGVAILPHLSATGPDIIEIHLALLLQCFIEAGLLDGLAEVIVSSDTFISVRATVLLGQLLHLIHLFLPPQICNLTPALPSLISQASAGKPQALAAVAALRRLHSMFESRPASNSLFLDHILQYCSGAFKSKIEDTSKSRKEKDNRASKARPMCSLDLHKDNSVEFLNESDTECEPKRHSIGSRADVAIRRNVSALVKSTSVGSRTSSAVGKVTKTAKFFSFFERGDSDSLIKSSLVMQNKDGNTWNWEIIRTILKETDSSPLLNLNDSGHREWASRIINYLKPSSNKYSHTDLSTTCNGHSPTRAGCQLIRHLLRHNDVDTQRMLKDLFMDVSHQIEAIQTGRKAHECLFSPQHMCNTMCQMYFLFIGQLCHSYTGLRLFKQTGLYENLLELSTKTHHSCYVKLVISSLDYTMDSSPRDILAKTLTCNILASRLYATQFLNVLLRASRKSRDMVRKKSKLKQNFVQEHTSFMQRDEIEVTGGMDMDTWILQMLVGQIKDESKAVVKCALNILEEAYSFPPYFDKLMTMRDALCQNCRLDKAAEPTSLDLSAVGDRGYLLWLGLEVAAAAHNADSNAITFVKKHLDFWNKSYNYRYVRLIEAVVHEALTLSEESRRPRNARRLARPPPHLFATLAALCVPRTTAPPPFTKGLLAAALPAHYKILQKKKCITEQEIADLKASLWAVGNTGVTPQGLQQLINLSNGLLEDSVPVHIVRLARYSPVYSVRATAFYVLGLIGSTYDGANLLADLGWLCVRHTRHDQFPVIPDDTLPLIMDPNDTAHSCITSPDRRFNALDIDLSEHSDHTDQSTAESLHSENIKLSRTIGGISVDNAEKEQDVVDSKTAIIERREDKRKSHTLPTQGSSSHERSLTESRTVDILRDCSSYERAPHRVHIDNRLGRMNSLDYAREARVRNTSESSTSGVSSCDSFLGKYAIPDRVLKLSPIPSSSSLYGMKSNSSSYRPRIPEPQRRTSTSSYTPDIGSSPPSQKDMSGYATIQSLNKHRRPHYVSESGASDIDVLTWLPYDSNQRPKPFSSLRDRAKTTRDRMTKLSLLEYDWKPLTQGESSQRVFAPTCTTIQVAPSGPRSPYYIGICLPRNLMELFPMDNDPKDTVEGDKGINRGTSVLADSTTPDQSIGFTKSADMSTVTSTIGNVRTTTPSASVVGNASETSRIEANLALMSKLYTSVENKSDSEPKHDRSEGDSNKVESEIDNKAALTDSSVGKKIEAIPRDDSSAVTNVLSSNRISGIKGAVWRHAASDCLACVRTRPPSSHELREAFFAELESPSSSRTEGRASPASAPQAQLLHHVLFMSNPIHLRQARSALLTLKQRHPDVFRSPCVYSDVCALISRDTYMLCARRFLQELFLDTNFGCFLNEPVAILARHVPVTTLSPTFETTQ
ncbi:rapamycin-insensitive companion of mTOR [Pararge aegeria]|uniref:rapamycin-insensitive companion of mTOR n=1 Tax=Pararge aegeria TaxID=116150 RepID=UPI0019D2992C|nr:rapamycin-insensitive companion of mTOR [Pararge aegeria]